MGKPCPNLLLVLYISNWKFRVLPQTTASLVPIYCDTGKCWFQGFWLAGVSPHLLIGQYQLSNWLTFDNTLLASMTHNLQSGNFWSKLIKISFDTGLMLAAPGHGVGKILIKSQIMTKLGIVLYTWAKKNGNTLQQTSNVYKLFPKLISQDKWQV